MPRLLLPSSTTFRRLVGAAALALILILVVIQVGAFRESRALRQQLDQSYSRDLLLVRLLSLHQDVETGQRGYTITGNRDYLMPYLRAKPQISAAFQALQSDNPDGHVRREAARLKQLSSAKLAITAKVVGLRDATGKAAAVEAVASGQGKRVMDSIRVQISTMRDAEADRQAELLRSYASSSFRSQLYTGLLQLLLLVLVCSAFFAYLANVSRLRAVSAEARDSSDRQAAIFDAASDAMMVVDKEACVESVNPAAERLFALPAADLIGKSVEEIFEGGPLRIAGYNERRKTPREGDSVRNLTGLRGDGSTFEAEVTGSPVRLGEDARTLLVVRDCTERNRMERMKNEFVSTVSHELRTPLTSIRGALALMDHGIGKDLDEKPRQLLKIAKSNSERLSLLVDDILDIEKIGSGRLDLVLDLVDVREVLERAREQNQTYAADRGVRIESAVTDQPLIVSGDANRLVQAFTNLISNAAKFSPKDGLVTLIAERRGRVALIGVADHGSGIPVEFRSQIFNRFAQATGQSGQRTGTGLGLAITKAIIDLHKGKIDYETSLGEGTTFWINLPLAEGKRR